MLQAGDLFNSGSPSQPNLHASIELLSEHIFGTRGGEGALSVDTSLLGRRFKSNFESENINIKIPIFAVHGAKDGVPGLVVDSEGAIRGSRSGLEILHSAKLVNYIGKPSSSDFLELRPVMITKRFSERSGGSQDRSRTAENDLNRQDGQNEVFGSDQFGGSGAGLTATILLYGLDYTDPTTLKSILKNKKYKVVEPDPAPGTVYLRVLLLNQKRLKGKSRSKTEPDESKKSKKATGLHAKYIPKNSFDLLIWGGESTTSTTVEAFQASKIVHPGSTVRIRFSDSENAVRQFSLIEWFPDRREAVVGRLVRPSDQNLPFLRLENFLVKSQRFCKNLVLDYDVMHEEALFQSPALDKKGLYDHLTQIVKNAIEEVLTEAAIFGAELRRGEARDGREGAAGSDGGAKRPVLRVLVKNCPRNLDNRLIDFKAIQEEFESRIANK